LPAKIQNNKTNTKDVIERLLCLFAYLHKYLKKNIYKNKKLIKLKISNLYIYANFNTYNRAKI